MITAAGATYDKTPYVTNKIGEMEGNWGPDSIMQKAISGYTPNVAWMKFKTVNGFDIDEEAYISQHSASRRSVRIVDPTVRQEVRRRLAAC